MPNQTINQETAMLLLNRIKHMTKKPFLKGTMSESDTRLGIYESKIGGIPYWDFEKEAYPERNGKKMLLLAQIVLDELPAIHMLPKTGILQFFIPEDEDLYGLDGGHKIIYHKEVTKNIDPSTYPDDIPYSTDEEPHMSPVRGELKLQFEAGEEMITMDDYRADRVLHEVAKWTGLKIPEKMDFLDLIDALPEETKETMEPIFGTKMLGWPVFTQGDPRQYENQQYGILLLQLDSCLKSRKNQIMWGDTGICNFFINGDKLLLEDFSDVLYNWDCF